MLGSVAYVLLLPAVTEATVHVDDLDISPSKIGETAQRIVDRAIEEARRLYPRDGFAAHLSQACIGRPRYEASISSAVR